MLPPGYSHAQFGTKISLELPDDWTVFTPAIDPLGLGFRDPPMAGKIGLMKVADVGG